MIEAVFTLLVGFLGGYLVRFATTNTRAIKQRISLIEGNKVIKYIMGVGDQQLDDMVATFEGYTKPYKVTKAKVKAK